MLNVKCEACEAPYQVDERRVPAAGLKMRCPKCGHSFLVQPSGEVGPVASPGAPPAGVPQRLAPPVPKISPFAAPVGASAPGAAPAPSAVPGVRTPGTTESLPTMMQQRPKASVPPPSMGGIDSSWGPPEPVASFGELDLPAVATSLPVVAAALPALSAPPPRVAASLPAVALSQPERAPTPAPRPAAVAPPVAGGLDLGFDMDFGNIGAIKAEAPKPPSARPAAPLPFSLDVDMSHGAPPAAPAAPPPFSLDLPPMPTETAGHLTLDKTPDEVRAVAPAGPVNSGLSLGMPGPDSTMNGTMGGTMGGAGKKRPTFLGTSTHAGGKGAPSDAKRPAPKVVIGAAAAVILLGGGSLELTKAGAFGRYAISDLVHASGYHQAAEVMLTELHQSFALDEYKAASQLSQKALRAPEQQPRAVELHKASVLAVYMNMVRFGSDSARLAQADQVVGALPAESADPVVEAAQRAARGDFQVALDRARSGQSSPYTVERALITAESLYGMRRTADAVAAYTAALPLVPGARVRFALARCASALGDTKSAGKWLGEVLAANPNHFEAKVLSLRVALETTGPDEALLRELENVIASPAFGAESARARADAFSLRGDFARASGRPSDADRSYANAVALDPTSASALVGQAEVYFQAHRFSEAGARFDAVRVADPTRPDALLGVAKSKLMQFLPVEAKRLLEDLRTRVPTSASAAYWLGRANERLGDKDAAEKLYVEAMGLAQPKAFDAYEPYVAMIDLYYRSNRIPEAQALETKAMSTLRSGTLLSTALGDAALSRGAFEDAVRAYALGVEACGDKEVDCAPLHLKIGAMYRHQRNFTSARTELDRARALDPLTPGLAVEEGRLFVDSGETEKAIVAYTVALEKNPADMEIPVRLADAYLASGKPEKAIPYLEKLTTPTSGNAAAFAVLARVKLAMAPERALDALPMARRAVELDVGRADLLVLVAQIANEAVPPQLGLARESVERALGMDPANAEGYVERANVERKSGSVQDALKDVRRAIELAPGLPSATVTLAECLEDTNQRAEAHSLWIKAVANSPSNLYWQYKLGQSFRDRGAAADAAQHLKVAIQGSAKKQTKPVWYEQALFAAGMSMTQSGARKEGSDYLRQFLATASDTSADRKEAQDALGTQP